MATQKASSAIHVNADLLLQFLPILLSKFFLFLSSLISSSYWMIIAKLCDSFQTISFNIAFNETLFFQFLSVFSLTMRTMRTRVRKCVRNRGDPYTSEMKLMPLI